jgi:hypothetical protein
MILDGYQVYEECPTPPKPDLARYGAIRCHPDDECAKKYPGCQCHVFLRTKKDNLLPDEGWRYGSPLLSEIDIADYEMKCFCTDPNRGGAK